MKPTYNNNNRGYRESDESFFEYYSGGQATTSSATIGGGSTEFWMKCEDYDSEESSEITYQGRLFQKNAKTKKWQAFHFELYSDRLLRVSSISITNQPPPPLPPPTDGGDSVLQPPPLPPLLAPPPLIEFIALNACFLKKIKYSDTSYSNYKYGIRLQRGDLKTELFTESADNFNKLYEEIKRFCILPKFSKKYKVLTKFKTAASSNGGQGQQIHLYKCFRFSDSTQYCVKIVDKYSLGESLKAAVLRETAILRKVDHPTVVKLFEVFEDETNIFLVYELLQGKDLKSKVNELLCMDEKTISDFIWKLLNGLQHLHQRNVMHRDIKLDNIFFRSQNNFFDICISNFIAAEFIDSSKSPATAPPPPSAMSSTSSSRRVGTPGYIAPEVIRLSNKNFAIPDGRVDIFSLGVIFYFFVFGRMPFEGKDQEEVLRLNEKCEVDFDTPPIFGKFTASAFDLMRKMLEKDPKKRGTAVSLLNHTWFVNMKNKNPNEGGGGGGGAFETLSTVVEMGESMEILNDEEDRQQQRRRIVIKKNMLQAAKIDQSVAEHEFCNLILDDDLHASNYIHNVIVDGSLCYEDEFVVETVHDKMNNLNKVQFLKVPSKGRHDSLQSYLAQRLALATEKTPVLQDVVVVYSPLTTPQRIPPIFSYLTSTPPLHITS